MAIADLGLHPYITDHERLTALRGSGLLSDAHEPALDRWTRLAAGLLHTPVALLSMVDEDRQFFKSQCGTLGAEDTRETPLDDSFCKHVVATGRPLTIPDAREELLLQHSAPVIAGDVIAYAGRPVTSPDGHVLGSFCVVDTRPRAWSEQELGLLADLSAGVAAELDLRAALRDAEHLRDELATQVDHDPLTTLLNRRPLARDLQAAISSSRDMVLAIFDLDGFKSYNDAFGHPAGDALLVRMAVRLRDAVGAEGRAYRLGGDEFCVLVADERAIDRAAAALAEHGEGFAIGSSHGRVRLDDPSMSPELALHTADALLYGDKGRRSSVARQQVSRALMSVICVREPELDVHVRAVAELTRAVAVALGLRADRVDEVVRAAELHDIGKVAIPDSLLTKPGPLDDAEWAIMRTHTLLGERILRAAPALAGVAALVRSTHERWDGRGYPDGLAAEDIPLGSRIVFACDAFHAMTSDRAYRGAGTVEEAVAELERCAGHQFDPAVVEALVPLVRSVPVGA